MGFRIPLRIRCSAWSILIILIPRNAHLANQPGTRIFLRPVHPDQQAAASRDPGLEIKINNIALLSLLHVPVCTYLSICSSSQQRRETPPWWFRSVPFRLILCIRTRTCAPRESSEYAMFISRSPHEAQQSWRR